MSNLWETRQKYNSKTLIYQNQIYYKYQYEQYYKDEDENHL